MGLGLESGCSYSVPMLCFPGSDVRFSVFGKIVGVWGYVYHGGVLICRGILRIDGWMDR